MEMSGLESQEEDAPKRILFFKSMSWLGRSDLTVGMSPGRLVFDRHFYPRLREIRSRRLPRNRSRLATEGNFS
jgi:hypothetical protein